MAVLSVTSQNRSVSPNATDRNVYILGAGFSSDAGAPLVRDFLDVSRQVSDDPSLGLDPEERVHFRRVLEFRRKVAQAREKVRIDLDDIEQLFGLVEISHRLQDTKRETRDSTVYLIAKTLQLSINRATARRPKFSVPVRLTLSESMRTFLGATRFESSAEVQLTPVDQYDYVAALFSGQFDLETKKSNRKDTVITFNYDLVLEHALRRLGLDANYHLDPAIVDDRRAPAHERRFDVLKLHGSTNWGICSACGSRVVILSEKVSDSPDEFRSESCPCIGQRGSFQPFLIPPSWDKSEYRRVIAPVWKKAVEELKLASRICVIGYSMPQADAFFRYLLAMALAENHQLYKFLVVDYRNEDQRRTRKSRVEARYRRLLDPLFRERRFEFRDDGLFRFLVDTNSRLQLGRAELLPDRIQA